MVERKDEEKRENDYRAGVIASTIARVHATEKTAKKYTPAYFFSSLSNEKGAGGGATANTPEAMKQRMMFFFPKGLKSKRPR